MPAKKSSNKDGGLSGKGKKALSDFASSRRSGSLARKYNNNYGTAPATTANLQKRNAATGAARGYRKRDLAAAGSNEKDMGSRYGGMKAASDKKVAAAKKAAASNSAGTRRAKGMAKAAMNKKRGMRSGNG